MLPKKKRNQKKLSVCKLQPKKALILLFSRPPTIQLWVTNLQSWSHTNLCPENCFRLFIWLTLSFASSHMLSFLLPLHLLLHSNSQCVARYKINTIWSEIDTSFRFKKSISYWNAEAVSSMKQVCWCTCVGVAWMREICSLLMERGNISCMSPLGKGWPVMISVMMIFNRLHVVTMFHFNLI